MSTITWAGYIAGEFSDPYDWDGFVAPGPYDVAVVSGAAQVTVTSVGEVTVNRLLMGTGSTLLVESGRFTDTSGSGEAADDGTIAVSAGATFQAGGKIDLIGQIRLEQTGTTLGSQFLVDAGGLKLEGGGELVLEDPFVWTNVSEPCPPGDSQDKISSAGAEATLTNVDDTIVGAGAVGESALRFVNDSRGVVDASLTTALTFKGVAGGIVNQGRMEATGGGGLYVVSSTLDQVGGGELLAAGGDVYLSYAEVVGGELDSAGSREIYLDHGDIVLDGAVSGGLAIAGRLFVSDGATATLEGTIGNGGQIVVGTGASQSELIVGAGGATLSGGGQVTLAATNARVAGSGGVTLTNLNDLVCGRGLIGGAGMSLVNAGTIESDTISLLTLSGAVENIGTLAATGGGGLDLLSVTIANAGGVISAGRGASVNLEGATIDGGVLTAAAGGRFVVVGSGANLDGSATVVQLSGEMIVRAGATLAGEGVVDLAGLLSLDGAADFAGSLANVGEIEVVGGALSVAGPVTGAGFVVIDGGSASFGAAFSQRVVFNGAGALVLADSQAYTGAVWKFSTSGTDSLELKDISFGAHTKATFSGASSGGVLTVTDGTHSAEIALRGDYTSITFTVSSDGHGGVLVTDPITAPVLAQAMAGFSPAPAAHPPIGPASDPHARLALIASPR